MAPNSVPSQGWKTFLHNHADGIAAMDLFVVPTISFRLLYGLLILGHGRRQILSDFEQDLRRQARTIIIKIFKDLFGQQALSSLTVEGRKFLGLEILDAIEPNPELDV